MALRDDVDKDSHKTLTATYRHAWFPSRLQAWLEMEMRMQTKNRRVTRSFYRCILQYMHMDTGILASRNKSGHRHGVCKCGRPDDYLRRRRPVFRVTFTTIPMSQWFWYFSPQRSVLLSISKISFLLQHICMRMWIYFRINRRPTMLEMATKRLLDDLMEDDAFRAPLTIES